MQSDCDFIVVATVLPGGAAEAGLRRLHDEIPARAGFWTRHLEGSYADVTSLRGADGLGTRWLFCDHGHRELTWDAHCNSLHTRWILRNHGITLAGSPIADLVDEVPPQAMRDEMRAALPGVMPGLKTWAPFDVAWTQRYAVSTYCRVLYTLHTAEVASKHGALEWARDNLDPKWRPLLTQVMEDRKLRHDPLHVASQPGREITRIDGEPQHRQHPPLGVEVGPAPRADRPVALRQRPVEAVELRQPERLAACLVQPGQCASDRRVVARRPGVRRLPGGGTPLRKRLRQEQRPRAGDDDPAGDWDRRGHGGPRADQAEPAELSGELLLPRRRGVELGEH